MIDRLLISVFGPTSTEKRVQEVMVYLQEEGLNEHRASAVAHKIVAEEKPAVAARWLERMRLLERRQKLAGDLLAGRRDDLLE